MRVVIPLFPVYNHRLGVGYLAALLRARAHEVLFVDFEHILRLQEEPLSLRLQDETEVYADNWSEQIQYLHRPELLFGALWPEDAELRRHLADADWQLIDALRPHVESWADAMAQLEPDVLLLPALVSNLWIVLWASALVNERNPAIPRVIGGRGVSYAETHELILGAGWAEAVLPGEGEESVVAAVAAIGSGRAVPPIMTGSSPADLDRLPFPSFEGLPFPGASLRYYTDTHRDFHDAASLAGSRWCPRRCAYCYESVSPRNYRLRHVQNVVEEIRWQFATLGTPRLFFCDSTLNVSPRWLGDLADGMCGLHFQPQVVFAHCEPRALHRGLLDRMRRAGFEKVNFGIESLDARTLRRMDRSTSVEETADTLVQTASAGISLGLNLVGNYPGETQDEFETTLSRAARLAERLRAASERSGAAVRFMVSQARVDPHSSLFVNRERFGLHIRPRPLSTPAALAHVRPLIDRIALRWEDGLSKEERHARFAIMRPYIEALSLLPARVASTPGPDARAGIDMARVPLVLRRLVATEAPVQQSA